MQADLSTLEKDDIRSIAKANPLTEEQAQSLITKEENGRGRKRVINFLDLQARTAKRSRILKQIQEEGIVPPTV